MNFRKWIFKIHIYGGILCFWYIIIFGLSSLNFHHHFEMMTAGSPVELTKEADLTVIPETDNSLYAKKLQDSLRIPGWIIPWQTSKDSLGFHTVIQNPKAKYTLHYRPEASSVQIKSNPNGIWRIISFLHGNNGKMPHAPLLFFWKIFTWLCVAVVLFAIFSGIWLWSIKKETTRNGWMIFSGILLFSFALILIIYFHG